jgi:hypothetical protein
MADHPTRGREPRSRLHQVSDEQNRASAIVEAAIAAALLQLTAAEARTEALARFEPARRRALLFTVEPRMVPLGRVWRLGVFLLGVDGKLYATGHTTRAVDPRHPGYQSVSAEERRGYRAAAFRGPFDSGETVNFDAEPISLGAGADAAWPLVVRGDQALVRWSPAASDDVLRPFDAYLAERVGLLVSRPDPS